MTRPSAGETRGFDAARLARIRDHLAIRYVDAGKISGCQLIVARQGQEVYRCELGTHAFGVDRPVSASTLFRIHSLTKPVTSVAVMQLVEAARLQLTDPVERFLPSWSRQQVLSETGRLERPSRPVTVHDLLTHTSGLTYGNLLSYSGAAEVHDEIADHYERAGVTRDGQQTLETFAEQLADVPLAFDPGRRWHYSIGTEVLARIVELVSGQAFDSYLDEQVLGPLGMASSAFWLREDEDRLATNYRRGPGKELTPVRGPAGAVLTGRPNFLSGAGGLLSTGDDYLRFCEMLRRGGTLDGQRLLAPSTIRSMVRNRLPGGRDIAAMTTDPNFADWRGVGFGLGFAVTIDGVAATSPVEQDYYWDGAASALFWVDARHELSVVFMTQLMPQGTFNFRSQLRSLVYGALEE